MKIAVSNICTAFDEVAVGTKVKGKKSFMSILEKALETYVFPDNGQGFISLPEGKETVSSGVALRSTVPSHNYFVTNWREEMEVFASRKCAAPVENLNVVVYTRIAYTLDSQVSEDEARRIRLDGATHIIVAVLASVGPKPPVSSSRFVRNLAGGNARYTAAEGYSLDEAIREAKEIVAYEKEWVTVSD